MDRRCRILVLGGWLLVAGACGGSDVTSPSLPESTTTPDAAPSISESWTDTVPIGGMVWYSFSMAQRGTVQLTLLSVNGRSVPPDATLGLAVGVLSGSSCATPAPTSAQAGSAPQLTGTYDAGLHCASVSDVGELVAPAVVSLAVAHP